MSTIPLVSQLRSLWQLATGDPSGAKETWDTFIDAWSRPGQQISDLADNIPIVGHIKGFVHLALGDTEHAVHSEEAATRTLAVLGAGALTIATGGTAAPVLAGVVAGMGAGLVYDAVTTGIESTRHNKYDPQGYLAALQEGRGDVRGAVFDTVVIATGDALMGVNAATGFKNSFKTTKIYRVEGESFWKNGRDFVNDTNRRLFPTDNEGVVASLRPSRVYPGAATAPGERGVKLFLNFGRPERAAQFYAQRLLQHHEAVAERLVMGDVHLPVADPHKLQIKSFRIMNRDAMDIQMRSVPERGSRRNPNNQGIIEVDVTRAPQQFGCDTRVYTPLLQDAVRGSYKETTPWISHLPPRLLHLIKDHPVTYGHVRTAVIKFKDFSKLSCVALVADRIKDDKDLASLQNALYPLSQLSERGADQIDVEDEPVIGIRHVRLSQCGRRVARDVNHGQHFEYLVEFSDHTFQWFPTPQVAPDLIGEFEVLSMRNAKEVTNILDSEGDRLKIRRIDGSVDTVPQTQVFWREEEPGNESPLSREELDAILYHEIHGHDYDICTPATLSFTSDWAKVEVLTPGTIIRKDHTVGESSYNDVVFTPTSVMWQKPHSYNFRSGMIRFCIVNNGTKLTMRVSRGRDGRNYEDHKGEAHVAFQGEIYSVEPGSVPDDTIFAGCVVNHFDIHTPARLVMKTDWAEVRSKSAKAVFRQDPSVDPDVYKDVVIKDESIKWGKEHSYRFRNDTLPFEIVHGGTFPRIDIETSHGRDAYQREDRQGSMAAAFESKSYESSVVTNDEQRNTRTFAGCQLRSPPAPVAPPAPITG